MDPWTHLWADEKASDDSIRCMISPESFEFRIDDGSETGDMHISGYACTDKLDAYNTILEPECFTKSLPRFFENNAPLLFMHQQYGIPIGQVTKAEVKAKGLWVEATIMNTAVGRDIQLLVRRGVISAFSVGFSPVRWEDDQKKGIRRYLEVQLNEVSVVNNIVAATPKALFDQAKRLGAEPALRMFIEENKLNQINTPPPAARHTHNGGHTMELGDIEKRFATNDTVAEIAGRVTDVQKAQTEAGRLLTQLSETAQRLKDNAIDKNEFATVTGRMFDDFKELRTNIETIQNAQKIVANRIPFTDFRALDPNGEYVFDDNGRPLPRMHQRAHLLFNQPIEMSHPEAVRISAFRNCHDALLLIKASSLHTHSDWRRSETAQIYMRMLEEIDPELAKAMKETRALYSTGAGVGDEWVPTEFSSNLQDFYRLEAKFENYFYNWAMPSQPAIWPILAGGATAYKYAEPTTNNPAEATASDITTAQITFTARGVAARIPASKVLLEDSIVGIAPVITQEIATCLAETFEDMIFNGDTTSPHLDNGTVATYVAATNPITYFKGLRKISSDLSTFFDVLSATANVGDGANTFGIGDVRACRRVMGVMGVKPENNVFFCSVLGYYKILELTVFATASSSGLPSTYVTGVLEEFDRSPIYTTSKIADNLNASGVYDGSTVTKTLIGCVNKKGFAVGQRGGTQVEMAYNALTGQYNWIGSFRKDFQNMQPSSRKPVGIGYNLTVQ